MTEVHSFAHAGLEGSCVARCEWLIVIVLWFLADGFWYGACFGILHSECCGNSVNKEGFALQCVYLFQLSKIPRQKVFLHRLFCANALRPACSACLSLVQESVRRLTQVPSPGSRRCVFLLSPRLVLDLVRNDRTSNRRIVTVLAAWSS